MIVTKMNLFLHWKNEWEEINGNELKGVTKVNLERLKTINL